MSDFFGLISRMKYINRWSLMRNNNHENIAEHSMMVAAIAHCLAVINNRVFNGDIDAASLSVRGLYHDAAEVIVGDLPTPVKYFNENIKDSYKALERDAEAKLLNMLPEVLREDYRALFGTRDDYAAKLLKAADKISAYIKCVEELSSGNNEFKHALQSIKADITSCSLPEADYFMKVFGEAFGKTLDQLN